MTKTFLVIGAAALALLTTAAMAKEMSYTSSRAANQSFDSYAYAPRDRYARNHSADAD